MTGIKLNAEATIKGDRLTINQANLESSVGSAQGAGSIVLSETGKATSGSLEFQLQLTPEGNTVLGGYLALAARVPVENPASNWKISLRFVGGRAEVSVRPA